MDAQLVIEKGSSRTQTIQLKSEAATIGREAGCEVRIPSAKVSRQHCRLTFQDGVLRVEDLDSANGTFVNGERIRAVQVVRPGDRLEVGPITFLVKYQLSQAAIDHLLEMEQPTEQIPEIDVEELTESETPAADAATEKKADDSETEQFAVTDVDEPKKKAKKKPKKDRKEEAKKQPEKHQEADEDEKEKEEKAESQESETGNDVEEIFGNRSTAWQPPAGQDMRELLSGLDDG